MEGEEDTYDAEDIEQLLAEAKQMSEARSKNGSSMEERVPSSKRGDQTLHADEAQAGKRQKKESDAEESDADGIKRKDDDDSPRDEPQATTSAGKKPSDNRSNAPNPKDANGTTAQKCDGSCKKGVDPRQNDEVMAKLVDELAVANKPTLKEAAGKCGLKGEWPKIDRLRLRLALQPHKQLILLLSFFKIAKSAPVIDKKLPHPNWSRRIHTFPSGPRSVYFNAENRMLQSIPQTHRYEEQLASSATAQQASPEKCSSFSFPANYRSLPALSPNFVRLASNMRTTIPPDSTVRSRYDALTMEPGQLGDDTECLRTASTLSLSADPTPKPYAQPILTIPPAIPPDSMEDTPARMREWEKLKKQLPPVCFTNMCGGNRMFEAATAAESWKAIDRKAILAAGAGGSSLARDRICIEKYHAYCAMKSISPPPYPVPAPLASNMAEHYMQASPLHALGGGTSVGPGIMAAWSHLKRHFGMPVDLQAPVASSIAKHISSGRNKCEPVPLYVWRNVELLAKSQSDTPLRFYMRNLWLCIASSARAKEFWRVRHYDRYSVPGAACLFEIQQMKQGDQHVVTALSDTGLTGTVDWMREHMETIEQFGYSTPRFDGADISSATFLRAERMPKSEFAALVLELYRIAGLKNEDRIRMRITAHSPHATADCIAATLQWNDTARSDLGRWAHKGGQNHMAHRYATRASAINQMYLRSTLIQAIKAIAPADPPAEYDIEHLRHSSEYDGSIFVGPFVTYNIETAHGTVYDAVKC